MKLPPRDKKSSEVTPTGRTPARLPAPPAPAVGARVPAPPRLPSLPRSLPTGGVGPGRRGEAPSDVAVTHRLERITVERTPAPLPPSPAAADAEKWFEQVPTNPSVPPPSSAVLRPTGGFDAVEPPPDQRAAPVDARPPWLVPVLIAAISLTIGMILGALLFGDSRHGSHPVTAPADCPPPSANPGP